MSLKPVVLAIVIHISDTQNSELALQRPHYSTTYLGGNLSKQVSFDRHLLGAKPGTAHV